MRLKSKASSFGEPVHFHSVSTNHSHCCLASALSTSLPHKFRPKLSIAIFLASDSLAEAVFQQLSQDRYEIHRLASHDDFFGFIEQEKQHLDCLILQNDSRLPQLANWLHGHATLLPAILLASPASPTPDSQKPAIMSESGSLVESTFTYHTAEVLLRDTELGHLSESIEQAINQFLNLSPTCRINSALDPTTDLTTQNFLLLQQRRLS